MGKCLNLVCFFIFGSGVWLLCRVLIIPGFRSLAQLVIARTHLQTTMYFCFIHLHEVGSPCCHRHSSVVSSSFAFLYFFYLLTCVGIHPGRVEPASPIELATSRTEALQPRWSCASSLKTFTQFFLHRAWLKTRGRESDSRTALIVIAHVFSWPPGRLRHVRGGVGRSRSLISSPSTRLAQ